MTSVPEKLHSKSLDEWRQYLRECNIIINPFGRSPWESNPSILRKQRLNKTGESMNLNISDEIRSKLISPNSGSGMDQVRVSVISSIRGGGKTRLLLELLELLQDFDALYFITLNERAYLSSYEPHG
ncbi:hypothetical protein IMSHALPRED_000867 [Imshaugia aleurites]|uniref:Uncharacterized protein n=1 Tax=Imshaugia aleurites TaxID=172621 RepID=A0A8H3IC53_9LECA|nr:hypothetical protein IMSHALPRED_000867 [Imshaugia aleurites]